MAKNLPETTKKYRKKNADKIAEYRKKNADKIAKQKKEYRKKNADKIAKQRKEYRKKNRDKIAKYERERYQTNLFCKLQRRIHEHCGRIAKATKYKKTMPSLKYLGCTLEEFKTHIESKWQEGMTWENHAHDGWHMDHIVPIDWFVKNSDDPWKANHFKNLQPMWANDNFSKGKTLE